MLYLSTVREAGLRSRPRYFQGTGKNGKAKRRSRWLSLQQRHREGTNKTVTRCRCIDHLHLGRLLVQHLALTRLVFVREKSALCSQRDHNPGNTPFVQLHRELARLLWSLRNRETADAPASVSRRKLASTSFRTTTCSWRSVSRGSAWAVARLSTTGIPIC